MLLACAQHRPLLVWCQNSSTSGCGGERPTPTVSTACPLSVVGNAGGVATWPYLSIPRSKLPTSGTEQAQRAPAVLVAHPAHNDKHSGCHCLPHATCGKLTP